MDLTERTVSSEEIYNGKVVHLFRDVVTLPNGANAVREVIRHQGAVAVVPLTEKGEAVLVRQYRYPFGRPLLEIPAGKLEAGENPEEAVKRELEEETGAQAERWTDLGDFYPTVAYGSEVIRLYLAEGLTFGQMHTDEDEFLNVERVPLDVLVDRILSGEIKDGKTQAAVLKTRLLLDRR